jgi:hypothetical protein
MANKTQVAGTIPGWFTVIMLGVLCYMMKMYWEDTRALLRSHEQRIQAVELWRATMEGRK